MTARAERIAARVEASVRDVVALYERDPRLADAYCTRTGRAVMPGYDDYVAFNVFRIAAIFHGIHGAGDPRHGSFGTGAGSRRRAAGAGVGQAVRASA